MILRKVKPSRLVEMAFPKLTCRIQKSEAIYLTFDDGPVPGVTEWVLDTLKQYDIKATFFCVAENVSRYPEIYRRIIDEGHSAGNHTYNHLNNWKIDNDLYLENIKKASIYIDSPLFRPPYGKLGPRTIKEISKTHRIILWDVLTKDYDKELNPEVCVDIVKNKTTKGSIVVFHDSYKAEKNLRFALPLAIEYLLSKNFVFEAIPMKR